MMRIGQVVRLSSEGTIIIRSQTAPPMGAIVCDNRGRDLGRIIRVTGPVSSPYAIIKPVGSMPEGLMRLIGGDVYLSQTVQRRERPRADVKRQYERRDDRRGPGGFQKRGYDRPRDHRYDRNRR
jgi:rRNA processing protein Gar1